MSPETGALAPIHRFQDQINRTNWNSIGFSKDDNSEYVMGGSSNKMGHNVFIWDKDSGVLVKVLEGPKEPLLDSDVSESLLRHDWRQRCSSDEASYVMVG